MNKPKQKKKKKRLKDRRKEIKEMSCNGNNKIVKIPEYL